MSQSSALSRAVSFTDVSRLKTSLAAFASKEHPDWPGFADVTELANIESGVGGTAENVFVHYDPARPTVYWSLSVPKNSNLFGLRAHHYVQNSPMGNHWHSEHSLLYNLDDLADEIDLVSWTKLSNHKVAIQSNAQTRAALSMEVLNEQQEKWFEEIRAKKTDPLSLIEAYNTWKAQQSQRKPGQASSSDTSNEMVSKRRRGSSDSLEGYVGTEQGKRTKIGEGSLGVRGTTTPYDPLPLDQRITAVSDTSDEDDGEE